MPGSLPPFRPILSSIGTYNYNLAQYLGSLLSPHIPSEYSTKDSFPFIEEIKSVSVTDKFLISFDVTSLFTNIPLSEAIDIAINLIFENSPDIKFTKRDIRKLFRIATSETHFTFNGSIFDQIDGVAMGSPLAPVLANLFMGFHEQNWIEQATNVKPIFYKRYVDDIFAIFESESDADAFYSYLNTRHENIKFTFEKEKDNKLPFLDILINNNESDLQTSVFHKKTYTGLLMNCFSFVPNSYKLDLIKTLVDQMYRINNSWTGFDKELKDFKNILQKNQYPLKMIDHIVKSYLNDKINCRNGKSSENAESEIKIRYFKPLFIGLHSKLMQKKIDQLCKRFCKSLKIKLVFTSEKLRCAFSTKDPYQSEHLSKVIYKFVCASCNANCVGQTSRHFETRIDEHVGKEKKSHIYQYLVSPKDCLDKCSKDYFSVLDTQNTKLQLRIKESLWIPWLEFILNKQKQYQYIPSLSF